MTQNSNGARKIIIADDEKPMANALELKLNHSGFEAKAVYNGQQALDEIEKNGPYDLMLLDLMMPSVLKIISWMKKNLKE